MKGNIHLLAASSLALVFLLSCSARAERPWSSPFDAGQETELSLDSSLSLGEALQLVANANPAFKAFDFQLEAAKSNFKQAGIRPNPELSVDLEEVGWNAPGFRESELTILLSQEFEPFGQRGARKEVAQTRIGATTLQIKLSSFDLYLEVKRRFYALAHSQQKVHLSQASLALADEIAENITYRLHRGAALQSELLLAELERQKAQLSLEQARQDVLTHEANLVSLWKGNQSGMEMSASKEPDYSQLLAGVAELSDGIDSSRDLIQLQSQAALLRAENNLAKREARPTITLNGGFKKSELNDSKSFIFGISLPLPLFNRNQGTQEKIAAELRSLDYAIERSQSETRANLQAQIIRLNRLVNKHSTLDSLLLPTAERAYRTLQEAYEAGRVPYTQLLEAERSLNDLSFEHNDMLLAIQEQIITLEQITGVAMRVDEEN